MEEEKDQPKTGVAGTQTPPAQEGVSVNPPENQGATEEAGTTDENGHKE